LFIGLMTTALSIPVLPALAAKHPIPKETGVTAVGTIAFIDSGKRAKVVVELLRSGEDWRIAEVVWESGSLRGLYRRKAMRDAENDPR
jgi:hypothetical protein